MCVVLIWQPVVVVDVYLIQSCAKLFCYLLDGMDLPIPIGNTRYQPGHDTIPAEKDAVLCKTCHCPILYFVCVKGHSAVHVPLTSFARRFAQDANDISPG